MENKIDKNDESKLFNRIKKSLILNKSYTIKLDDDYKIKVKNLNDKKYEEKYKNYESYIDNIIFLYMNDTLHVRYTCITEINNLLTLSHYYTDILINKDSLLNKNSLIFDDLLLKSITKINDLIVCNKCFRLGDKNNISECICILQENMEEDSVIVNQILNINNDDKCAICLDSIKLKYDSVYFTTCDKKHYFHLDCISKITKSSCPICNVHCHVLGYRNIKFSYKCKNIHDVVIYDDSEDE